MSINQEKPLSVQPILGIPIFVGTKGELLDRITSQISRTQELMVIFTPNPEQIALSLHNSQFKKDLQAADLNLPDGQGLVWALKRQGVKIRRLPGRVIFKELLELSRQKHWRVFLLGGRPGSAQSLATKYGFWFHAGAKDIQRETGEERDEVLSQIKKYRPQLVFVAYGAPWQEKWVSDNREELRRAGVRLVMVVGGAFDYEAGLVARVPDWIENLHLEWLWRLVTEPQRAKRQLKGLEFFLKVLSN